MRIRETRSCSILGFKDSRGQVKKSNPPLSPFSLPAGRQGKGGVADYQILEPSNL